MKNLEPFPKSSYYNAGKADGGSIVMRIPAIFEEEIKAYAHWLDRQYAQAETEEDEGKAKFWQRLREARVFREHDNSEHGSSQNTTEIDAYEVGDRNTTINLFELAHKCPVTTVQIIS